MKKTIKQALLSNTLLCSSVLILTSPMGMQAASNSVSADTLNTSAKGESPPELVDSLSEKQEDREEITVKSDSSEIEKAEITEEQETTESLGTEESEKIVNETTINAETSVLDNERANKEEVGKASISETLKVTANEIVTIDETNFPDDIFREWVKTNIASGADALTDIMISSVTSINISNLGIEDITGIQYFTNLSNLSAVNNKISYIDLTWFPNLKTAYFMNNKMAYLPGIFNSAANVPQNSSGEAIWNVTRKRWEYDPSQFKGIDKTNISDSLYSGTTNHGWAWDTVNQVMYRQDKQNFANYDFIYGYKGNAGNLIGGYYAKVAFVGIITARYVDEEGALLSEDVVYSGYTGSSYSTVEKTINGYELVSVQGDATGTFSADDKTVTYTYSPKVEKTIEQKVVKQVIRYVYADGTEAAPNKVDMVMFTRTVTKNLGTGEITYGTWEAKDNDTAFDEVTSPEIDNYTVDKEVVAAVTGLTADSKDIEETVTYTANMSTTTETKEVKQTIHYVYEDGKEAAPDKVGTVTFTRTVTTNEATGDKTYGEWKAKDDDTTFDEVTSPEIDNYIADKKTVDEVTGLTEDTKDSEVTVTYAPKMEESTETKEIKQVIHYVYEDGTKAADDSTDSVIFTRTATKNLATGEVKHDEWKARDDDTCFDEVNSPEIDHCTADDTCIEETANITPESKDLEFTVTYAAKIDTTEETKEVERVIHYVYKDGKEAAPDKTDTVTFTRSVTTNQLTGEKTYGEWVAQDDDTTFDAVTSPKIDGYAADKKEVEAVIGVEADDKDSEVTVTYEKEDKLPPTGESTTSSTEPSETSTSQEKGSGTTSGSTTNNVNTKNVTNTVRESTTSSKKLPSTGEKVSMFAMYGGGLMIVSALLGMVIKRFKRNPNE